MSMLLALAAMAEGVSSRSRPVRCLVLWILRAVEAVVRDFVADETGTSLYAPGDLIAALGRNANISADALRLAASFRAMAGALDDLWRQDIRPSPWQIRSAGLDDPLGSGPVFRGAGALSAIIPRNIHDAYVVMAHRFGMALMEPPRLDSS